MSNLFFPQIITLNNQPKKINTTQTIKFDYMWGPYVLFYSVKESDEPIITESEDCEAKNWREG